MVDGFLFAVSVSYCFFSGLNLHEYIHDDLQVLVQQQEAKHDTECILIEHSQSKKGLNGSKIDQHGRHIL